MRNLKKLSYLAFSTLTLASCTPHLTQGQCQSMNWHQMGYSDGSQGRVQRNLQPMIADCAKFNIPINAPGYRKGWRSGTREFCRPSTAFKMGTEGRTYNNICPADLAPTFNRAWRRGIRQYCIPSTGYNLGRSGHFYPNFCPAELSVAFRNAYDRGYRIYKNIETIKSEINDVNRHIAETQRQIRRKNRDIDNALNQKKRPEETHRMRHERIQQDRQAIRHLNQQLNRMRDHRDSLQRQLNHENGRG